MSAQPSDERNGPLIVVGVDGSEVGNEALRWAVRQATDQHGTVRAIAVRRAPELMPATSMTIEPHGLRRPQVDEETSAQRLRELIQQATADIAEPAPIVAVTAVGDPERALADAATDADLLVVGSHSHGPLAEVFLGSVAAATVRHAPCPVVVIPNQIVDKH